MQAKKAGLESEFKKMALKNTKKREEESKGSAESLMEVLYPKCIVARAEKNTKKQIETCGILCGIKNTL